MNSPSDPKLTAWALNELSPEERETFESELTHNPDLRNHAKVTQDFCRFISSHLHDETVALSDAQRSYLTAATSPQRPTRVYVEPQNMAKARPQALRFDRDAWWRQPALILPLSAAAVLILGSLYYVSDSETTEKAAALATKPAPKSASRTADEHSVAKAQSIRPVAPKTGERFVAQVDAPNKTAAGEGAEVVSGTRNSPLTDPYVAAPRRGIAVRGQQHGASSLTAGDRNKEKTLHESIEQRPTEPLPAAAKNDLSRRNAGTATRSGPAGPTLPSPYNGATTLSTGDPIAGGSAGALANGPTVAMPTAGQPVAPTSDVAGAAVATSRPAIPPASPSAGPPNAPSAPLQTQELEKLGSRFAATPSLMGVEQNVGRQIAPATPAKVEAGIQLAIVPRELKRLADLEAEESRADAVSPVTRTAREAPSGESYAPIVENPLIETSREPLSTFSIDVDTAAYANIRRFLNSNTRPPRDAVRLEEMINYFPYDYELPDRADQPFAVHVDIAEAPWQPSHRLARIGIKGREFNLERKAGNFVFLIDVSGSMDEPNKLPLVQMSLGLLADRMSSADRVAIVTYAGSSGLVLPSTAGDRKKDILRAIDRMKAGGSTHGSEGIVQAYDEAQKNFIKGGVNRVILCTDGDFNVGVTSPQELEKLIAMKARDGVFLSVLGFGTGNTKDTVMETLADKGNGNYAYIDSLGEARKVLVEQMQGTLVTIAKDVKIQVEFNPAVVRAYRLIGYENRLLAEEDFNDDAKDAGEIGAGHTVTALYELVPVGAATTDGRPVVDDLKYQSVPAIQPTDAARSGEMMTVKLRYKQPEGKVSQLIELPVKDEGRTLANSPPDFKFAAAVAGFGLLLRDSNYKGALTWEQVRRLAQEAKGSDPNGYRGEFIQLIDKARGIVGGGEP